MKKLLLILLCLPIIGFGQNKFSQNSSSYKTKKNNKDKYHLADDYKLLLSEDGTTQNLKSIIEKMKNDGFEFRRANNGNLFFNNHGFNPFLAFSKSKVGGNQWKFIHTLDDDPSDILIWKVENSIFLQKVFGSVTEAPNVEALFNKGITHKDYTLNGSEYIYDYKSTASWLIKRGALNPAYTEVKFYTVNYGDCPMYEEDGSIAKDCQVALSMGNSIESEGIQKFLTITFAVENLWLSEWAKGWEPLIELSKNKKIRIPIIKEGNMNFISINIGGKSYKYLVDTGASDMVINTEMKDYLMQAGVLKSSDFGQSRIYEIANGKKVKLKTATLNSIEISGNKFTNIPIAIGDNASLLLGMSFLNKFHFRIDNNTLELKRK